MIQSAPAENRVGADRERSPLISRRCLLLGLLAALVATWSAASYLFTHRLSGLYNDFDFYWASGRMVMEGRNPYDMAAMKAMLEQAGLQPASTDGYSYPLLFAYLMVPLSLLPPLVAGVLFSLLSLAALALAVGLLFTPLEQASWPELLVMTYGAGSFAPITGSLRMGQVNLLVLLLLALAFRGVRSGTTVALASSIKLAPVVGLLALVAHGPAGRKRLLAGALGFGVLALLPNLLTGFHPPLFRMFTPDAYYTDESVNGFLSRLAGAAWHTAPGLVTGLPVEPVMVLVVALLGGLTFAVVLLARGRPWEGCLALLLAYASIAAPRNSLWDLAPLLLALAWCWPLVTTRPLLRLLLVGGWGLMQLQQSIYDAGPQVQAPHALLGLLGSTALYGAVLVAALTGFLLLTGTGLDRPSTVSWLADKDQRHPSPRA